MPVQTVIADNVYSCDEPTSCAGYVFLDPAASSAQLEEWETIYANNTELSQGGQEAR